MKKSRANKENYFKIDWKLLLKLEKFEFSMILIIHSICLTTSEFRWSIEGQVIRGILGGYPSSRLLRRWWSYCIFWVIYVNYVDIQARIQRGILVLHIGCIITIAILSLLLLILLLLVSKLLIFGEHIISLVQEYPVLAVFTTHHIVNTTTILIVFVVILTSLV